MHQHIVAVNVPLLLNLKGGEEMKLERRQLPITELRVESQEDEKEKIVGYAAVFDSLSENLGGFREKIQQGAFKRSLENGADVRALMNHDPNYILGRNKSGTLVVQEDSRGLKIEITPPETTWARDLMTSMDRGDISEMSFAFATIDDRWEEENGETIRTLKEVDISDVSVVTYPAYKATSVQVRSASQVFEDYKQQLQPETRSTDVLRKKLNLLGVED